ncbi:hypothetical protein BDK92_4318 [Micromonospora pisi]|uniref:Uncharacterized protein n=1 Tax=Micromonospora pisi TaxID=589240 RepID=A0A495JNK4_9ACTN|nr:hypothetical protein [Micromonospora pisi]RKR89954.1 hypothetical protein BDK92_4318 [Micromonospora pisi]
MTESEVSDATAVGLVEAAMHILCGPPTPGRTQEFVDFLDNTHRLFHFLGAVNVGGEPIGDALRKHDPSSNLDVDRLTTPQLVQHGYTHLVSELILTRTTDYFLTYISRLLTAVLRRYPESIKALPDIKVSDLLRLPDKAAVIQYAVDDYVRKLSYQGIRELHRDVKGKFGFQLFASPNNLTWAAEAIAKRNLIVHNNGIIDYQFTRQLPRYNGQEGTHLNDLNPLVNMYFLIIAAFSIDSRAQDKWHLEAGNPAASRLGRIFPPIGHRPESEQLSPPRNSQ